MLPASLPRHYHPPHERSQALRCARRGGGLVRLGERRAPEAEPLGLAQPGGERIGHRGRACRTWRHGRSSTGASRRKSCAPPTRSSRSRGPLDEIPAPDGAHLRHQGAARRRGEPSGRMGAARAYARARATAVVPVGVLGQAWRGGPQPQLVRFLRGCLFEELTEARARPASPALAGNTLRAAIGRAQRAA